MDKKYFILQFKCFGNLNVTFSFVSTISSIETLQCFFISDIRSCTSCSGAEAPDVIPIFSHLTIDSIGSFSLKEINLELIQPDFLLLLLI